MSAIKHIAANVIVDTGCGAMDSPYLERGESIVLTTDRVSINSRQYDLLLTTKYLILIDIRYARFLPQKIPLQDILSVKAGKIATGDLAITLYFSDTSRTGSELMNLIFSRQPGEQRDRERDDWLKNLMDLVVAGRQEAIGPGRAPVDQELGIRPATRRQIAPEMQLPHSTIIDSRHAPIELAIIHDEPEEMAPPEEPSSGAVDAELAGEESSDTLPEVHRSPEKVSPDEPEISMPGVPQAEIMGSDVPGAADAEVTQADSGEYATLADTVSPAVPEIIVPMTSREDLTGPANADAPTSEETPTDVLAEPVPLDGVPEEPEIIVPLPSRDEPAGSVISGTILPEETPADVRAEPVPPDIVPEEPEIIVPLPSRNEPAGSVIPGMIQPDEGVADSERPSDSGVQPAAPEPLDGMSPDAGREGTERSEIDIPEEGQPGESTGQHEVGSTPPAPGLPPPPPGGIANRQRSFIIAAVILILILGIGGIAVFLPAYFGTPAQELSPVPTPSLSQTPVPRSSTPVTPAPAQGGIPDSGVWVRITYPHDYYGRLGNPGSLREVSGSGDRFYQVKAEDRLVQVQIYKTDNSGDILAVEIYRDGELINRRTTSSPRGFIDLLIDSTTGAPPGIAPRITQTASAVSPVNQTRQVNNQTIVPGGNPARPAPIPTIIPLANKTPQIINQTNNQTGTGSRVMYF